MLRSRKRAKKGERRYLYYYYRCSGFDAHGHKGCSNSRFASASKLERQVWEVVRGILLDPEQLRFDLDRAIELERQGVRGNPEAQAKHWLEKISEVDEERRGFLRLSAKGRITDAELDEELDALNETRKVAEEELEALRDYQERVEQLERNRDEVLDYYAAMAPEKLDALTSEERRQLYQILKLKVMVSKNGDLEMGLAAVPVDSSGDGGESSTMGVRQGSAPTDGP